MPLPGGSSSIASIRSPIARFRPEPGLPARTHTVGLRMRRRGQIPLDPPRPGCCWSPHCLAGCSARSIEAGEGIPVLDAASSRSRPLPARAGADRLRPPCATAAGRRLLHPAVVDLEVEGIRPTWTSHAPALIHWPRSPAAASWSRRLISGRFAAADRARRLRARLRQEGAATAPCGGGLSCARTSPLARAASSPAARCCCLVTVDQLFSRWRRRERDGRAAASRRARAVLWSAATGRPLRPATSGRDPFLVPPWRSPGHASRPSRLDLAPPGHAPIDGCGGSLKSRDADALRGGAAEQVQLRGPPPTDTIATLVGRNAIGLRRRPCPPDRGSRRCTATAASWSSALADPRTSRSTGLGLTFKSASSARSRTPADRKYCGRRRE